MQDKWRIRFRRCHGRARAGYTLVFCVLMLFGLMGLAALVIDLGMVRIAQRQMQTAADAAALEGLRYRDDPNVSQEDRDTARRQRARFVVAALFDDNLDPSDGDPMRHDAGPILHFDASQHGDPSLDASRLIDPAASGVYKPQLQLNVENAQHGDIVAGSYSASPQREGNDYSREDFALDADSALLVRQRRTNDFLDLDNQPGVSSSGPALPLLFGRGGLTPAPRSGRRLFAAPPRVHRSRHGNRRRSTGFDDRSRTSRRPIGRSGCNGCCAVRDCL